MDFHLSPFAFANGLSLIAVTVLVPHAVSQARGGPTPTEMLHRSMQRQTSVNVKGIISQRDSGSGVTQTIRVERDKEGRSRYLVLSPLRMQGIESVDDGVRFRMYWPDRNRVMDQESPSRTKCDADWRIELTQKNYKLKFVPSPRIAGRATKCVEATPLDDRMEIRRFYVDSQTFYPLRLETYDGDQLVATISDTQEISYPSSVPKETFILEPVGSPMTMQFSRPKKLKKSEAEKLIGFVPIVPKTMPMGFAMQDMQLSQNDKWKSVAIRITDGLVRGTVYQWRATGQNRRVEGMDANSTTQVGDIKMMLISDLDSERRRAMLQAFIENALVDGLMDLCEIKLEPSRHPLELISLQSRDEADSRITISRHSLRKETRQKK